MSLTEPCQGGIDNGKCPAETGITRKIKTICNSTKETEEIKSTAITTEATTNTEKAQTKETTKTNANGKSVKD